MFGTCTSQDCTSHFPLFHADRKEKKKKHIPQFCSLASLVLAENVEMVSVDQIRLISAEKFIFIENKLLILEEKGNLRLKKDI